MPIAFVFESSDGIRAELVEVNEAAALARLGIDHALFPNPRKILEKYTLLPVTPLGGILLYKADGTNPPRTRPEEKLTLRGAPKRDQRRRGKP